MFHNGRTVYCMVCNDRGEAVVMTGSQVEWPLCQLQFIFTSAKADTFCNLFVCLSDGAVTWKVADEFLLVIGLGTGNKPISSPRKIWIDLPDRFASWNWVDNFQSTQQLQTLANVETWLTCRLRWLLIPFYFFKVSYAFLIQPLPESTGFTVCISSATVQLMDTASWLQQIESFSIPANRPSLPISFKKWLRSGFGSVNFFALLVHGQMTIIFVVSVGLSVCLFVQSFSQPCLIRFQSN